MNRKLGAASAVFCLLAVLGFAISMPFGWNDGSYFCSMLLALGFVPMMGCFLHFAEPARKSAGHAAASFAGAYAAVILPVYFTQLTAVRAGGLTEQARQLLDFQQMGLFFSFDLLGYALMSLAAFFAGLTLRPETAAERWLRALLLLHAAFVPSCLLAPVLGLFRADTPAWIGIAVLEVWCACFVPIAALSCVHFLRQSES